MAKSPKMPVEKFIEALKRRDPHWPIKKSGNDYYTACPVHGGDHDNSLSFTDGRDGRLLAKCHSKDCAFADIMKVVGLRLNDGFAQNRPSRPPEPALRKSRTLPATPSETKLSVSASITKKKPRGRPDWANEIVYDYTDVDGTVVFQVSRVPLVDASGEVVGRQFHQRRRIRDGFAPTLQGGWFEKSGEGHYKKAAEPHEPQPSDYAFLVPDPVKPVLYRQSEVLQAKKDGESIFIAEGEKDADTVTRPQLLIQSQC